MMSDTCSTIRQVVAMLAHDKGRFYFAVFLCIVGGVVELVGVGTLFPFLALLSKPHLIESNKILQIIYTTLAFTDTNSFLIFSGVAALLAFLFSTTFMFLKTAYLTRFCVSQSTRISVRLLDTYLRKPILFHLENNSGSLSKDVIGQSDQFTNGVLIAVMTIFGDSVVLLVLFCLVLSIDVRAGLLVFITLGVLIGTALVLTKNKVYELSARNDAANGDRFNFCIAALQSVKEIKAAGKEAFFGSMFCRHAEEFARCYASVNIVQTIPQSLIQFIATSAIICIAIYHISIGTSPAAIVPTLAMYAVVGYRLMPSFNRLSTALSQLQQFKPIIRNISTVLQRDASNTSEAIPIPAGLTPVRTVELRRISFKYPKAEQPLFTDLQLLVAGCQFICIVGSSGAGKTTLVDLLLGLLPPDAGTLLVNGISMHQAGAQHWRSLFGYVPQAVYLTDGTIEENIAFGVASADVDHARLERIVVQCHLEDFISAHPDGLKAHVGERGGKLSGGQRQRLGIARALYRDPPILILDESTSSLDGISEAWIIETLKELKKNKLIISIAHRSSLVRSCDRVIYVNQGSVVADGSFQHLCATYPAFVALMSAMEHTEQ